MYSAKQLTFITLILAQLLGFIQCGVYDNTDKWVLNDKSKSFPDNAVVGGYNANGYSLYVGRAVYSSNILPARVTAETGNAFYSTDTTGGSATSYELLTCNETTTYHWIRSFDGFREKNAVSVGTSATNDRVYVCRALTENALLIGTLFANKPVCYIRLDNLNLSQFDKYEVLVRKWQPAQWIALTVNNNELIAN